MTTNKKKCYLTLIAISCAVTCTYAIDLIAEADTYVRGGAGGDPSRNYDYGSGERNPRLLVRSLGDPTRAVYAYIRFDLSAYRSTGRNTSFCLTAIDGARWNLGQLKVYGLPVKVGLTPQDWKEASLSYDTTGSEFIKPVSVDNNPFNISELIFLGDMPAGAPGESVSLSSEALDIFLYDHTGGMVTLLVACEFDANRSIIFASREAVSGAPMLKLND